MANEIRIRSNNVFGSITNNPLTNSAVTINSAGLVNLATIVGTQNATMVLDPLRVFGAPEIIIVTAHGALASSATVIRGAYGTTARSHPQGTFWTNSPLSFDFIAAASSTTRPATPYTGEFSFETDTNKLIGWAGVDWAPRDAGGQLGYAQNTSAQNTFGGIQADITGLTTTVTIGTARRIRVSSQCQWIGGASDMVEFKIREQGVTLQTANCLFSNSSGNLCTGYVSVMLTPLAGQHTYNMAAVRTQGAGTETNWGSSNQISWIMVEDIGAAQEKCIL